MFKLKKMLNSIKFAVRGVQIVWREEQNFRIQTLIALIAITASFVIGLGPVEKAIIFLCSAVVLVLELMNSVFERMVDLLKPRLHHYVAEVKDIMAATVLVFAASAAAVGIVIFWPHLARLGGQISAQ